MWLSLCAYAAWRHGLCALQQHCGGAVRACAQDQGAPAWHGGDAHGAQGARSWACGQRRYTHARAGAPGGGVACVTRGLPVGCAAAATDLHAGVQGRCRCTKPASDACMQVRMEAAACKCTWKPLLASAHGSRCLQVRMEAAAC
eukprot:358640-Chlamydomonas_euryale.AAC.3